MHIVHLDRFRSVGRCAIFGFVFLGQKNHKMHIARILCAPNEDVGRLNRHYGPTMGCIKVGTIIPVASDAPDRLDWMCDLVL
jgi:hypothetical protein